MKIKSTFGLIAVVCLFVLQVSFSQNSDLSAVKDSALLFEEPLLYPALVQRFYQLNGGGLFWTDAAAGRKWLKEALKKQVDSCAYLGLEPAGYHQGKINALLSAGYGYSDSLAARNADRVFTDAAIAFCKDVYQGKKISQFVEYDEISKKYADTDNDTLLYRLAALKNGKALGDLITVLQPEATAYRVLKDELKSQLAKNNVLRMKQLAISLNLYRWTSHFRLSKYIVVNIPAATLNYYQYDTVALHMKVVVGKPSTKTPRFAAFCNQVILYPYWNVPVSIAVNELLPKVKRNPAVLDEMNMQVVDAAGNVVAPSVINWHAFSKKYFPYRFRQSTGCDNSLGVIKFNITDPYSVYLHDTNNKTAFLSGARFYSHGCIRLEKPVELGNLLLDNKLDTAFLQSCYRDQIPVPLDVIKPVPVFVIYALADTDAINRITYYKDVYGLLKK